jgi:hypothetical protein
METFTGLLVGTLDGLIVDANGRARLKIEGVKVVGANDGILVGAKVEIKLVGMLVRMGLDIG